MQPTYIVLDEFYHSGAEMCGRIMGRGLRGSRL